MLTLKANLIRQENIPMVPSHDDANHWQIHEAKTNFPDVVERALHNGDQFIIHKGDQVAVVMSKSRYQSLLIPAKSIVAFFLESPYPDINLDTHKISDSSREINL